MSPGTLLPSCNTVKYLLHFSKLNIKFTDLSLATQNVYFTSKLKRRGRSSDLRLKVRITLKSIIDAYFLIYKIPYYFKVPLSSTLNLYFIFQWYFIISFAERSNGTLFSGGMWSVSLCTSAGTCILLSQELYGNFFNTQIVSCFYLAEKILLKLHYYCYKIGILMILEFSTWSISYLLSRMDLLRQSSVD